MPHAAIGKIAEVAAGPLINAGASIFGVNKQAQAAQAAAKQQAMAQKMALQRETAKEAEAKQRNQAAWNDYRNRLTLYYQRYGDKAIDRYGYAPGYNASMLQQPGAGPGGAGAFAPGERSGGAAPVVMSGGRTVSPEDYDAYVKAREARRAGGTLGGMLG